MTSITGVFIVTNELGGNTVTKTEQNVGGPDDPYFAGDSITLDVTVEKADGTAFPLSGATISWVLADHSGADPLLDDSDSSVTTNIVDSANGELEVVIDSGATDNYNGKKYHELEVEASSGDKTTVLTGAFIIRQDTV